MTETPRRRRLSEREKALARDRASAWYANPDNSARQRARIAERRTDPVQLEKLRAQGREAARRWREANPEKKRAAILRHRHGTKYGMTDEQIARVAAGGMCDVCGTRAATDIDHCHERNVYRGYLCHGCNAAAGMLADDPVRAEALARYLRQTSGVWGAS